MPDKVINRRRILQLAAAAILPGRAFAGTNSTSLAKHKFTWRGAVMGAEASLTFYGAKDKDATAMAERCLAEIDRLENIFSLFRDTSEISQLNRTGMLAAPSTDMRALMALAIEISELSNGKFDPTIQPFWRLNRDWFARYGANAPPPAEMVAQALDLVDCRRISLSSHSLSLGKEQQITLNGIAQGYITDRISALLASAGWTSLLINLGEIRTLGTKPDGGPFQIRLEPSRQIIPLSNRALASSSPSGFVFPFKAQGQLHGHLIDPLTGQVPDHWRAVHVTHSSAAIADGLSTAFCTMSGEEIRKTMKKVPGARVWTISNSGKSLHF